MILITSITLHTRYYTKIVLLNDCDSKFSYFYLSRNTIGRLHYLFRFRSTSHFYLNNKLDKMKNTKTTTTNFLDSTISGSISRQLVVAVYEDGLRIYGFLFFQTKFEKKNKRRNYLHKIQNHIMRTIDALFINIQSRSL